MQIEYTKVMEIEIKIKISYNSLLNRNILIFLYVCLTMWNYFNLIYGTVH
jgi:hypothetical protein